MQMDRRWSRGLLAAWVVLCALPATAADIYQSFDAGKSWSALAAPVDTIASAGNGSYKVGVDAAGAMHITRGGEWSKLNSPTGKTMRQVVFGFSGGHLYAIATDDTIWWSNDYGNTWRAMSGRLRQLAAGADSSIWGVNAGGEVWGTFDLGRNWIKGRATAPSGQRWSRIAVAQPGVLAAVAADDSLWLSRDKAQNWTAFQGRLREITATPDGSIWGVNAAGDIWTTSNYGQNWRKIERSGAKTVAPTQSIIYLVEDSSANDVVIPPENLNIPNVGTTTTTTQPVTGQPIQLTTTTSTITLNSNTTASDPFAVPNPTASFDQNINVTGCVSTPDYSCVSNTSRPRSSTWVLDGGGDCTQALPGVAKSRYLRARFTLDGMDCSTSAGVEQYSRVNRWFLDLERRNPTLSGSGVMKVILLQADRLLAQPESTLSADDRAALGWFLSAAYSLEDRILRQAYLEYTTWKTMPCAYPVPGNLGQINRTNFYSDFHCSGDEMMTRSSLSNTFALVGTAGIWETPKISQFRQAGVSKLCTRPQFSAMRGGTTRSTRRYGEVLKVLKPGQPLVVPYTECTEIMRSISYGGGPGEDLAYLGGSWQISTFELAMLQTMGISVKQAMDSGYFKKRSPTRDTSGTLLQQYQRQLKPSEGFALLVGGIAMGINQ